MLEEIAEAMEPTPLRVGHANSKKDDKRKEALACRDKAMTTWAKAGASGDISDSGHESDNFGIGICLPTEHLLVHTFVSAFWIKLEFRSVGF